MRSARKTDDAVVAMLQRPHPLPEHPIEEQIVFWRTFRRIDEAAAFSHAIMPGDGQTLVGGRTRDSLGELYWIGVHVDDLGKWGNTKAIQLSDPFDPENPDSQGRAFG